VKQVALVTSVLMAMIWTHFRREILHRAIAPTCHSTRLCIREVQARHQASASPAKLPHVLQAVSTRQHGLLCHIPNLVSGIGLELFPAKCGGWKLDLEYGYLTQNFLLAAPIPNHWKPRVEALEVDQRAVVDRCTIHSCSTSGGKSLPS
jgi:hypothetical protein